MLNNKTIKPMLVAMSSAVPGLLDPVFSYNEWPVAFWVTVSYYRGIFGRVWWRLGLSGELPIPHFPDPVPHASVYPGSETEHTETKKIEGRKGMVNKEKLSRVLFDTLRRLRLRNAFFLPSQKVQVKQTSPSNLNSAKFVSWAFFFLKEWRTARGVKKKKKCLVPSWPTW